MQQPGSYITIGAHAEAGPVAVSVFGDSEGAFAFSVTGDARSATLCEERRLPYCPGFAGSVAGDATCEVADTQNPFPVWEWCFTASGLGQADSRRKACIEAIGMAVCVPNQVEPFG